MSDDCGRCEWMEESLAEATRVWRSPGGTWLFAGPDATDAEIAETLPPDAVEWKPVSQ